MFNLEGFVAWLAGKREIAQYYINEAEAFSDDELEWKARLETIIDVLAEIATGRFTIEPKKN